jgi:antitoxin PrlF
MSVIHEVATITSKGQITLPKSIRQALGVDSGAKVAFDLQGSQVVVSRVEDDPHQDPAIASFLALLEKDIASAQNISTLPKDLALAMLSDTRQTTDWREEIDGDVEL